MYIIVGLGNPGQEYAHTRHNTGRMTQQYISEHVPKLSAKFVFLDTFMNKSGQGIAKVVKSKGAAKKLIVIHDDLDLPLGTLKISYNRGSGGHKGLESIIRALKTKEFVRIRIGIGPTSPRLRGASKKADVEKHILGKFKKSEMDILKKVFKRAQGAVETIVTHGLSNAMTEFNSL
ncbi:MAG: Peptidyl-tRNA hydrolase [Parcubacteria group bacterium GW2011_GWA2_45_15]|nr:MAG: Peptidyl-tRNA hydrolase [Parcubacteria group bacterium GW2011_GWA2_45_15]